MVYNVNKCKISNIHFLQVVSLDKNNVRLAQSVHPNPNLLRFLQTTSVHSVYKKTMAKKKT